MPVIAHAPTQTERSNASDTATADHSTKVDNKNGTSKETESRDAKEKMGSILAVRRHQAGNAALSRHQGGGGLSTPHAHSLSSVVLTDMPGPQFRQNQEGERGPLSFKWWLFTMHSSSSHIRYSEHHSTCGFWQRFPRFRRLQPP